MHYLRKSKILAGRGALHATPVLQYMDHIQKMVWIAKKLLLWINLQKTFLSSQHLRNKPLKMWAR